MMKKESYTATQTKSNSEVKKKQQVNTSKIEKPKFQYEKIKFFSERDLMELMSD